MSEELRRYRALACALIVTLVVAVALFMQFLSMDLARAEQALGTELGRAASNVERRIGSLIERLETLGRAYLMLGASHGQLLGLMYASDLEEPLESLCTREDGTPRILHTTTAVAGTVVATGHCVEDTSSGWTPAAIAAQGALVTKARLVSAPYGGDRPSLELRMRMRADDDRELRASVSSETLLETATLALGESAAPVSEACLSLQIDDTPDLLACHGENPMSFDSVSRDGASFGALAPGGDDYRRVERIETAGLHWYLSVIPDHRLLAAGITSLPFVVFGCALAIGALVCAFVYLTVDRNLRLEARGWELQRLLERLEQQNRELDQFAAMAAHDLQTPIRFVVANAHILRAELDELERPDLTRIGATLIEQGERMRELVLDLLAFCRAGESELNIAPVDVRSLVEEEIDLVRAQNEYAEARFSIGSLPRDLPCDAGKLSQVVRNLLGNAVKFSQSSSPPTIRVGANRHGHRGDWTFRIEDNGPGIEEEHRERIFLPFTRLDSGTKGTGIGLAIVKKLLERHGGTIWVDEEFIGGSAFCFTLPGAGSTERS